MNNFPPPIPSSEQMQSDAPSRKGFWPIVATALGCVLLFIGVLALMVSVSHFARAVRFLVFGADLPGRVLELAIPYNFAVGGFNTVEALIFVGLGWLLVRKQVPRERLRKILWIAAAIAVVLGITAGFSFL